MARGQIWQKFPKLLRFMARFASLEKAIYKGWVAGQDRLAGKGNFFQKVSTVRSQRQGGFGQKLKGSFLRGVVFAKGLVSLGEGFDQRKFL